MSQFFHFGRKYPAYCFFLAETTNQSLWSLKVIELLSLRKIQKLVGLLKLNCVFTMIVTHKKGDMQEEKGCHSMVVSVCVKLRRSQLFWLVFFNLIQTRVTWENGISTEELPTSDCAAGHVCETFKLAC